MPDDLNVALRDLSDQQEIREVMLRYCRGIDRHDAAMIASAFHPDARGDYGEAVFRGDQMPDVFVAIAADLHGSSHVVGNILVEIDGDVALAETMFVVHATVEHAGRDHTRIRAGRYVDRLERRDGDWRIAHRVVVDTWSRLDPLGARPAGTTYRLGAPAPDDLVYARDR